MARNPDLKAALSHAKWNVIEIFGNDAPGLLELLEKDGEPVDHIHGNFRDVMVRHGDDGGWCVNAKPRSKLYNYLERIRVAAEYPSSGEVFYLVVKRD